MSRCKKQTMYSGGQSIGMFCQQRTQNILMLAHSPARSLSKDLPHDQGRERWQSTEQGKAEIWQPEGCQKSRVQPLQHIQPAVHWGLPWRTPTPRPLAFSCRNFRNLVRKMYLEASPFKGREKRL